MIIALVTRHDYARGISDWCSSMLTFVDLMEINTADSYRV